MYNWYKKMYKWNLKNRGMKISHSIQKTQHDIH